VADYDTPLSEAQDLARAGRYEDAERACRRALQLAPSDAAALCALGAILIELDRWDQAIVYLQRAVKAGAESGPLSAANDAVTHLRRATETLPDNAGLFELAASLEDLDRLDEAIPYLHAGLKADPEDGGIYRRLALAYRTAGAFEQAVYYENRAAEVEPTAATYHSLAVDQLRLGRYVEGWRNYEQRPLASMLATLCGVPKWNGLPLNGRTLLVYADGGLGDTIQFARFLPMVVERARGMVIFQCQAELIDLFGDMPGIAKIVPRPEAPALPQDPVNCYINLLSVPGLFGTDDETIPSPILRIRVDDEASARWRERIAGLAGLKVGLRWAGNPNFPSDRNRSMHLKMFSPLAAVKGLSLVSLQLGLRAGEVHTEQHGLDILSAPDDLASFGKTAALIGNLDLIISTCTSVPHLAGAMGVETWLLLPFVPHWCWNVHRPMDTPWYPRHRLFRQPRPRDWGAVIDRVAGELSARIALRGDSAAASGA
jgi:Flp pilus assembly protein TadD